MSIDDYYISQKPTIYPDFIIKERVRDAKLNFGVRFNINEHSLVNDPKGYEEHLRRRMAVELGNKIKEEGKLEYRSYDSPVMGHTLEAETLVMTYDDLYALLGHFGIYVKVTEPKKL